jgi:hypothetical protein
MNLIIAATLSEPPTEALSLRYVTLAAKHNLNLDCLIEAQREAKDAYYRYLLARGLMDFIEQLVTPEEHEQGIRLDSDLNFPLTIQVKAITVTNTLEVLGQIKTLKSLIKKW